MKETPQDLYKLKKKDIRSVGPILRDAFQHDPVWNKLFEYEKTAEKKLSAFFEVPVRFCKKLHLDTREICRKVYHRPVQELFSRIHPRLAFERNYDALRPVKSSCEEMILLQE